MEIVQVTDSTGRVAHRPDTDNKQLSLSAGILGVIDPGDTGEVVSLSEFLWSSSTPTH